MKRFRSILQSWQELVDGGETHFILSSIDLVFLLLMNIVRVSVCKPAPGTGGRYTGFDIPESEDTFQTGIVKLRRYLEEHGRQSQDFVRIISDAVLNAPVDFFAGLEKFIEVAEHAREQPVELLPLIHEKATVFERLDLILKKLEGLELFERGEELFLQVVAMEGECEESGHSMSVSPFILFREGKYLFFRRVEGRVAVFAAVDERKGLKIVYLNAGEYGFSEGSFEKKGFSPEELLAFHIQAFGSREEIVDKIDSLIAAGKTDICVVTGGEATGKTSFLFDYYETRRHDLRRKFAVVFPDEGFSAETGRLLFELSLQIQEGTELEDILPPLSPLQCERYFRALLERVDILLKNSGVTLIIGIDNADILDEMTLAALAGEEMFENIFFILTAKDTSKLLLPDGSGRITYLTLDDENNSDGQAAGVLKLKRIAGGDIVNIQDVLESIIIRYLTSTGGKEKGLEILGCLALAGSPLRVEELAFIVDEDPYCVSDSLYPLLPLVSAGRYLYFLDHPFRNSVIQLLTVSERNGIIRKIGEKIEMFLQAGRRNAFSLLPEGSITYDSLENIFSNPLLKGSPDSLHEVARALRSPVSGTRDAMLESILRGSFFELPEPLAASLARFSFSEELKAVFSTGTRGLPLSTVSRFEHIKGQNFGHKHLRIYKAELILEDALKITDLEKRFVFLLDGLESLHSMGDGEGALQVLSAIFETREEIIKQIESEHRSFAEMGINLFFGMQEKKYGPANIFKILWSSTGYSMPDMIRLVSSFPDQKLKIGVILELAGALKEQDALRCWLVWWALNLLGELSDQFDIMRLLARAAEKVSCVKGFDWGPFGDTLWQMFDAIEPANYHLIMDELTPVFLSRPAWSEKFLLIAQQIESSYTRASILGHLARKNPSPEKIIAFFDRLGSSDDMLHMLLNITHTFFENEQEKAVRLFNFMEEKLVDRSVRGAALFIADSISYHGFEDPSFFAFLLKAVRSPQLAMELATRLAVCYITLSISGKLRNVTEESLAAFRKALESTKAGSKEVEFAVLLLAGEEISTDRGIAVAVAIEDLKVRECALTHILLESVRFSGDKLSRVLKATGSSGSEREALLNAVRLLSETRPELAMQLLERIDDAGARHHAASEIVTRLALRDRKAAFRFLRKTIEIARLEKEISPFIRVLLDAETIFRDRHGFNSAHETLKKLPAWQEVEGYLSLLSLGAYHPDIFGYVLEGFLDSIEKIEDPVLKVRFMTEAAFMAATTDVASASHLLRLANQRGELEREVPGDSLLEECLEKIAALRPFIRPHLSFMRLAPRLPENESLRLRCEALARLVVSEQSPSERVLSAEDSKLLRMALFKRADGSVKRGDLAGLTDSGKKNADSARIFSARFFKPWGNRAITLARLSEVTEDRILSIEFILEALVAASMEQSTRVFDRTLITGRIALAARTLDTMAREILTDRLISKISLRGMDFLLHAVAVFKQLGIEKEAFTGSRMLEEAEKARQMALRIASVM